MNGNGSYTKSQKRHSKALYGFSGEGWFANESVLRSYLAFPSLQTFGFNLYQGFTIILIWTKLIWLSCTTLSTQCIKIFQSESFPIWKNLTSWYYSCLTGYWNLWMQNRDQNNCRPLSSEYYPLHEKKKRHQTTKPPHSIFTYVYFRPTIV